MESLDPPTPISHRWFLQNVGTVAGLTLMGVTGGITRSFPQKERAMKIQIQSVDSNFEREPLIRPFGFKGGYMTDIWQTAAWLRSQSGIEKIGLCTQNVLWSDADVFAAHSEDGGNALMYVLTERALRMVQGQSYSDPISLLEGMLDELYAYGTAITGKPDLRKTFVLNSLVGVDNAAWLLYAAENGITSFDDLIPEPYRAALSHHHTQVASIPLMAYSIPISEIVEAVDQGYFFMKIKIGQPGTQEEMLAKDKARLSAIHQAIGGRHTPHTQDGKLPYYFDANGRYENIDTLRRLLDHARKIGAFDQIALVEEPFPEAYEVDVRDLGVRIAADESAHTDADALKRIQMGYSAIALKAIAKTLSMTMKIGRMAHEHNVPCFCADLTVNPILVEWNKNIAARLAPFPELGMGLLETNGHQNYREWDTMVGYHPCSDAGWRGTRDGLFHLSQDFYDRSGCIFEPSEHYQQMFTHHS